MSIEDTQLLFIHGLESSSMGTKARYFKEKFPTILVPDFHGSLETRMNHLFAVLKDSHSLVIVGSSYGGLMATIFASKQADRVKKLILLAPALNFPEFSIQKGLVKTKTTIFHGTSDTVCPHNIIYTVSKDVFDNLIFNSVDDDHMLHDTFRSIPWHTHLA